MKPSQKQPKNQSGFTLIELLMYMALAGVVMVVATSFVTDVTVHATKLKSNKEVQQNARLITSNISNRLRNAQSIDSVTADHIDFTTADSLAASLYWDDTAGQMFYEEDGTPTPLAKDGIDVTDVVFGLNGSIIQYDITLELENADPQKGRSSQFQLSSSVLPRSDIY